MWKIPDSGGFGKHLVFSNNCIFFLLPVCGKYLLKRKSSFVCMIYSAVFSLLFKTHPPSVYVCVCDFLCGALSRFCTQRKFTTRGCLVFLSLQGRKSCEICVCNKKRPSYVLMTQRATHTKLRTRGDLTCTTRVKERRTVWIGREWQHWVDEVGVILGTEWTLLHSFQERMHSNSGNETLRAQKKGKKAEPIYNLLLS